MTKGFYHVDGTFEDDMYTGEEVTDDPQEEDDQTAE